MIKTQGVACFLAVAVALACCFESANAKSLWEKAFGSKFPTSIPEVIKAADTNIRNMPKSIPAAVGAIEERVYGALPEQNCGSCGCLTRDNGRCVACKPKEQCEFAKDFQCSCPSKFTTDKWEKQEELEAKFCQGQPCGPNGCCGSVRYGIQEGADEALNFATQTAIACAACTYGCGACAGAMAQKLIFEELEKQIQGILDAVQNIAMDLGNAASRWGGDMYTQLTRALQAIADDIIRTGKINRDGEEMIQGVDFGLCKFQVEPGMSKYHSKNCVYCCNCLSSSAVRFYLAWRLDCRPGQNSGTLGLARPLLWG